MKPAMMPNSVVLPAPLGPISAVMLPSRTVRLASATAVRPPKLLVMPLTSSMARRPCPARAAQPGEEADQPVRQEGKDDDQQRAVEHQVESGRTASQAAADLVERAQGEGTDQRTEHGAHPADQRHQQRRHRSLDALTDRRSQTPGRPAPEAAPE